MLRSLFVSLMLLAAFALTGRVLGMDPHPFSGMLFGADKQVGEPILTPDLSEGSVELYRRLNPAVESIPLMLLAFAENQGQWSDSILFRADAAGATMWFTAGGIYYQLNRAAVRDGNDEVSKSFPGVMNHAPQRFETMMIKTTLVGALPNTELRGEEFLPRQRPGSMENRCAELPGGRSGKRLSRY
jgi:hypothetical protein